MSYNLKLKKYMAKFKTDWTQYKMYEAFIVLETWLIILWKYIPKSHINQFSSK